MENVTDLINQWSEERGLATNTRRAYMLEVERFAYWISHERGMSIHSCASEQIVEYFDALRLDPSDEPSQFCTRRRKALSPSSIEQTRRILKAFYEWGVRTRRFTINPLWDLKPLVVRQDPSNTFVEQSVIGPMVGQSADADTAEENLRLASIVHLAFWVGASTTEIAKLTVDDFGFNDGIAYISLPLRDSLSKIKVELPKQAGETLQSYLYKRYGNKQSCLTGNEPLISSLERASAVTGWTIWRAVQAWQDRQKHVDSAQLKGPRLLRRAFIEMASSQGAQETVLAKHLRRKRLLILNRAKEPATEKILYDLVARKIA